VQEAHIKCLVTTAINNYMYVSNAQPQFLEALVIACDWQRQLGLFEGATGVLTRLQDNWPKKYNPIQVPVASR